MEELGDQGGLDWKPGAGGEGREEALGWDHLRQLGLGDDYLDIREQQKERPIRTSVAKFQSKTVPSTFFHH